MIIDTDSQILESTKMLTLAQKCVDVFVDSFTVDRNLSSSPSVYGHWGAGLYDKDKVRAFYTSKESKFRKNLKKAETGLNVSVWKNFSENSGGEDTINYNFYYKGIFIFRLDLIFVGKSIQYNTYKELYYTVKTKNELVKNTLKTKSDKTLLSLL